MKKILAVAIVCLFVLSTVNVFAATAKGEKNRSAQAMDNIFYGNVEVADNLKQNNEKPFPQITAKKNDGFGNGIARAIGGVYQFLTPWAQEEKEGK